MIGWPAILNPYISSVFCLALPAILVCCSVGCGDSSNEVLIQGRVSFQGNPLENGVITFFPSNGRPVTTTFSPGGNYSCQLSPGAYRVTVSTGVTLPLGWKEGDPIPASGVQLPREFTTRIRTPLQVTVATGRTAPINLSLE